MKMYHSILAMLLATGFAASVSLSQPETKPPPAKPAPAKPEEPAKKAEPPKEEKQPEKSTEVPKDTPTPAADAQVLEFNMKDIDEKDVNLSQYKGKVVLMVNVASKCGYTPQYKGLEKLYRDKKDQGFVILGFPANNFGAQEPGKNEEIKEFCKTKFDVSFPMFAKISVKGSDQHPLYKKLAGQPKPVGGDPQWNFTKFLVDRQGNVVARFEPGVKPDDAKLLDKIKELLDKKG